MANDISKIKTPDGVVHDLKDSRVPANAKFTDTNYYHTTGSWNGLTYTATANGGAGALALTLPTGTTSTTVARGDHTHNNYVPFVGKNSENAAQFVRYNSLTQRYEGGVNSHFMVTIPATTAWIQFSIELSLHDYYGARLRYSKLFITGGHNNTSPFTLERLVATLIGNAVDVSNLSGISVRGKTDTSGKIYLYIAGDTNYKTLSVDNMLVADGIINTNISTVSISNYTELPSDTIAAKMQYNFNPMTDANDLIVGGTNGAPTCLAKGSNGTFLGINSSGNIAWAVPSNTTYSAGTGLSLSGTTFNHSNSVTAVTTAGLYKVKYDAQGHITGTTAVAKADITALGIPGSNTTYSAGTGLTLSSTTFSVTSANVSTMMNLLGEGSSPATRNDYAIVQYSGGGTTYTTYHRRKLSNVFAALNSSDITTALGYTPYNSTNPNGYTSNAGTVTRIISGTGLTGGPITSTGTLSVMGLPENMALGGEKQPIYWDHENGFVAGTAIGASAYHADSYFAAASHAHGNITSAGAVTTTATIANGDRILISDSSASSKVCASGITFGTGTGTFLNNKGEWGTPGGTNAGHTHTLKITTVQGTNVTDLRSNTTYKLVVGNASYQFKTPTDYTCLAEGTKILMADNSEKNIEDVVAGDIIMSYDPNTEKLCEAVIIDNIHTGRSDDFVNYYFDDGSFLSIFGKHCIYSADEGTARGVDYWEPGWKTISADGKEVMYIGSENVHNAGRKRHFDLHSSNKLYFANGILNAQSLTLDYPMYKDEGLPEEFITALKADFDSSASLHTHQFDKKTGSILAPILKELKAQKKVMDDNKKRLADSDYLVAKFTEGLISAAEWLKAKAERAGWRSAVNKAEPLYAAAEERYNAFKAKYKAPNTKRERFNAAVARDNACLDALKAYYKSKNEVSK